MAEDVRQYDHRTRLQKMFGYCPVCGRWLHRVKTYRQHTAYGEDAINYVFTGCKRCSEDNDAHWEDMWALYYSEI